MKLSPNERRQLYLWKPQSSNLQALCMQKHIHMHITLIQRILSWAPHGEGTMWVQWEVEEEGSVIMVVWLSEWGMNGCVSSALKGQPSSQPLSRVYTEQIGYIMPYWTHPSLYIRINCKCCSASQPPGYKNSQRSSKRNGDNQDSWVE